MKFRDEICDLINIESTNLYLNQNSYLPLSLIGVRITIVFDKVVHGERERERESRQTY